MDNISVEHVLSVSPSEAAGGTKKLVTVNGRRLEVSIPAGVKTGTIVKLRNVGIANDFVSVQIRIEYPGHPSSRKHRISARGAWAIGLVSLVVFSFLLIILSNANPESTPASLSPPPAPPAPVRLPTGTYLMNNLGGGLGELTIENGLDLDAIVVLSHPEQPKIALTAVYIKGEASHTITGIRDSAYVVYFEIGEDWDYGSHKFMRKRAYQRFDDNLTFQTTSRQYTTWELSLQPVPGGTASTEHISEDEFPVLVP
ncbi:MAG: hypothetical protein HYX80_06640 [Chloroflexi bacterium]|nr:hypothetical protein [Chloroflexota bacterium]